MIAIISQIILYMIAAAILGFAIGWIFSAFVKNEDHQSQIFTIREKFDKQQEQINQHQTNMDGKDRELMILKEEYSTIQREMLTQSLDYDTDEVSLTKISQLSSDNEMLIQQIKEQQICEDENELLKSELQEKENEKQNLLEKIEELSEFKSSYKNNIHKIAELESRQEKIKTKPKSYKENISQICEDKLIINNEDLDKIGLKADEISKVIKDIFSESKRSVDI